jgi:hypothetical protein
MQAPDASEQARLGNLLPMDSLLASATDFFLFTGLSWAIWRALGRSVPIAVLPIIIGLVLAVTRMLPQSLGIPAPGGNAVGWVGVLMLAFTAGLETRHAVHVPSATDIPPAGGGETVRFIASATLSLLVPFAAGTIAAKLVLCACQDGMRPTARDGGAPRRSVYASR